MSSKTGLLFMGTIIVHSVKDWRKLSSVGKSKTLLLLLRFGFTVWLLISDLQIDLLLITVLIFFIYHSRILKL